MPEATKLLILAACTLLVGIYAFAHARFYREGFPPLLDASISMVGFVVLVTAFVFGGRIGEGYGYLTEGRIFGLFVATIGLRWFRARLGVEQARHGRDL